MKHNIYGKKGKKGTAAAGAWLLALSLTASASASYTPGVYTGTAEGFEGDVTVTVTVDENGVEDVQIEAPDEDPVRVEDEDWLLHLTEQAAEAQDGKIDGISGATVTSEAVQEAVADALAQAESAAGSEAGMGAVGSETGTEAAGSEMGTKAAGSEAGTGAASSEAGTEAAEGEAASGEETAAGEKSASAGEADLRRSCWMAYALGFAAGVSVHCEDELLKNCMEWLWAAAGSVR